MTIFGVRSHPFLEDRYLVEEVRSEFELEAASRSFRGGYDIFGPDRAFYMTEAPTGELHRVRVDGERYGIPEQWDVAFLGNFSAAYDLANRIDVGYDVHVYLHGFENEKAAIPETRLNHVRDIVGDEHNAQQFGEWLYPQFTSEWRQRRVYPWWIGNGRMRQVSVRTLGRQPPESWRCRY